jgi:glycosyltransferase involved in cell wall biosynthesis
MEKTEESVTSQNLTRTRVQPTTPINKPSKTSIGLTMMIKNEEKTLIKSLNSTLHNGKCILDCFIIYDTGSTDNTLNILEKFCNDFHIQLFLIKGDFVDFSTSRNVLLDYAETIDVSFLILLDSNDEIQQHVNFLNCIQIQADTKYTRYLVCQRWLMGALDEYVNVRLIRNGFGIRYKGSVHEYAYDTHKDDPGDTLCFRLSSDDLVLYQNRLDDDDKSIKRFSRDLALLQKDREADPSNARTVFYLAQTFSCVGDLESAFLYYQIRTTQRDFLEEVFHSYCRMADLILKLHEDPHESVMYYMKALEYSDCRHEIQKKNDPHKFNSVRAEPLFHIAHYYYKCKKQYFLAFQYIRMCIECEYPHHAILYVNKQLYDYDRFKLGYECCVMLKKYQDALACIERCIQVKQLPADIKLRDLLKRSA